MPPSKRLLFCAQFRQLRCIYTTEEWFQSLVLNADLSAELIVMRTSTFTVPDPANCTVLHISDSGNFKRLGAPICSLAADPQLKYA